MKKIYTTLLAAIAGTSMMMAADGTPTFSFVRNGEVIADGTTLKVADYEVTEQSIGTFSLYIFEMDPKISVRNNTGTDTKAIIDCEAVSGNYSAIEFCWGNCYPWGTSTKLSSDGVTPVPANSDVAAQIHISNTSMTSRDDAIVATDNATVKLSLYESGAADKAVTLTLVFDTSASGISAVSTDSQDIEVYNLCGKRVADSLSGLTHGVYIVKTGSVSKKVIIKK